MQTGLVTTVQNSFVIMLKNILVEIMVLVTNKTTPALVVPVIISTAVTVVRLVISIVPMLHVMDMAAVRIVPLYHLVISVIVRQDLLVMTVK